jgi:hypothetical protein
MRASFNIFVVVIFACALLACEPDQTSPELGSSSLPSDASVDSAAALSADEQAVVIGVDDGARDNAVVGIDGAGVECAGVLVAGDALLTSSICVGPPGFPAENLAIRPGDPSSPPMAYGARTILSPAVPTVGAAVAIVLLDRPVVDALPTWIRTAPAILGEHFRTVGFEPMDLAATKLLRDHLPVMSGRLDEFLVSEPPCAKQAGSAAFDEDTEELVGLVLNDNPCGDPFAGVTYARMLPLRAFIEAALATPTDLDAGWGDGGRRLRGSKGKTSTDFREPCDSGDDCSTGVCVDQSGEKSCSRGCGGSDRCPTTTHCSKAADGDSGLVSVCADP